MVSISEVRYSRFQIACNSRFQIDCYSFAKSAVAKTAVAKTAVAKTTVTSKPTVTPRCLKPAVASQIVAKPTVATSTVTVGLGQKSRNSRFQTDCYRGCFPCDAVGTNITRRVKRSTTIKMYTLPDLLVPNLM